MINVDDLKPFEPLLKALNDMILRIQHLTRKAFPIIMSGKDAVGIAQTGTGKTFAYLIPIYAN